MTYSTRYDGGSWNGICDSCGRQYKAPELRKRWDGFYVCSLCYEPRQPQDFVRGVVDQQAPPWTRPVPTEVFDVFCTAEGRQSIAGMSVPGCWVAGLDMTLDPSVPENACTLTGMLSFGDYAIAGCWVAERTGP